MSAYFAKIKKQVDTLAIAGKLIGHADLVTHILTRLKSQKYKSLVTSLLAREESMSLDDLYALLLGHEIKIEQKKASLVMMLYTIWLQILLRKIEDCLEMDLETKEAMDI